MKNLFLRNIANHPLGELERVLRSSTQCPEVSVVVSPGKAWVSRSEVREEVTRFKPEMWVLVSALTSW